MNRRAMLAWTGAACTLGVAGCLGDGAGDQPADGEADDPEGDPGASTPAGSDEAGDAEGSTAAGPAATVESFYEALDSGDVAEINAFVHENASISRITDEEATELTNATYTPEEAETVEDDGETATVDVLLTVTGDERESGTLPSRVELRRADGAWKLWRIDEGSSSTLAPQVVFDVEHQEDSVAITHQAGDHVDADALAVRGDGLDATGGWRELGGEASGADGAVAAGDTLTVGVAEAYELSIVWTDPDSDASVTLHAESIAVESEHITEGETSAGETSAAAGTQG